MRQLLCYCHVYVCFVSCSAAALVKMKLRVDERYLHVLELDSPQKINGVLVTALDANQYVYLFIQGIFFYVQCCSNIEVQLY